MNPTPELTLSKRPSTPLPRTVFTTPAMPFASKEAAKLVALTQCWLETFQPRSAMC
jgi:hypothetical protein